MMFVYRIASQPTSHLPETPIAGLRVPDCDKA